VLSNSNEYKEYLLSYAKEKRAIIDEYFRQEMNFDEKFAFVEYWGRGYTQTCHTRLLQNVAGKKQDVPYYYMRSIYPTIGNDVRYNYTDVNTPLIFVEALFANIDYKSIEKYDYNEKGEVVPVKKSADCDMQLFNSMNKRLVQFSNDYITETFYDRDYLGRELLKFSLEYFRDNQTDEVLLNTVAPLIDAVGLFGEKREFAPAFTKEIVDKLVSKEVAPIDVTSSIPMSIARSDEEVKEYYNYLTVVKPNEEKEIKKGKKTKYDAKAVDFNNKLRILGFKNIKQSNMRYYKHFCKQKVSNCAVFFGENIYKNENYIALITYLEKIGVGIESLPVKNIYEPDEISKIATAKYIFTDVENEFFALMKFRKETFVTRIYKETFPVDRFGINDIEYGKKSDFRLKSKIYNANCNVLTVGGKSLEKTFKKAFKNAEKLVKPLGNPACDLYFNKDFIKCAQEKCEKLNKNNKKIITYLPKQTSSKRSTFDYVDIDLIKKYLAKDYVLFVKTEEQNLISAYANAQDDFCVLLGEDISAREAIAVSDVIIGDYSSIMVESALCEKPIIFTGIYENAKCEISGAKVAAKMGVQVAADSYELIEKIENSKDFDVDIYKPFVKKYLGKHKECRAENIIKYLNETR
ncbi:MAG: CDP-glycerol glycerophosphotransferase family protein, partial [Clostridia bacterium]|nr:CDP-glycerol glycerophosphotransferase family protein [Clostridia bacterium]